MQTPLHLLRVTLQAVRDAVVTTDQSARILTMNLAAEAMTGWSEAEALGKPIEEVIELRESATDAPLVNPAYPALESRLRTELKPTSSSQTLLIARGGRRISLEIAATPLPDADGSPLGAIVVFHNVSEARQMAENLAYQAQHDPLTGLPNRILLVDRLEQATKFADRQSDQLATMFLSIKVADSTATPPDAMVKEAAMRLTSNLRESDTVCRLSNSEFILLLPGIKTLGNMESLAAKLISQLTLPYPVVDSLLVVTCSVGVSLYPQDATDAGTLMRLADEAMHHASKIGVNQFVFAKAAVESDPVAK